MLPILKTPEADKDTDAFFLHLAEENVDVALKFLDGLRATLSLIAEHPKIAPRLTVNAADLPEMRWFPVSGFPNHLVIYSVTDVVTVIRVMHRSQEIGRLLQPFSTDH